MAIDKESANWLMGRAGEDAIREWLKNAGYFVIPAADIENGGAPMLEGLHSRAILPDFLSAVGGKTAWVEVKTKSRPTYYVKLGREEHGLPSRHWFDYLACEEQTGIPGFLCVYELSSGKVLMARIKALDPLKRLYSGPYMGGKPHVFLPRQAFDEHAGPAAGPAPRPPINPRVVVARDVA